MLNMIKLKAMKYPNILHYEWEGELLERTENYRFLLAESTVSIVG
ncbi:hypothetical protein [Laceyella putida]|uniref:Uncharacterized protein n=1 Tax=Laceyella putida TaxID=110101 RepID=A0ABW2RQ23_9BACL